MLITAPVMPVARYPETAKEPMIAFSAPIPRSIRAVRSKIPRATPNGSAAAIYPPINIPAVLAGNSGKMKIYPIKHHHPYC